MNSQQEHESPTTARFSFGKNWLRFLRELDDYRIHQAEQSLCRMLKTNSLRGKRFLDAGSGSGLFSLAARRLGASVLSFDSDNDSVKCTDHLRTLYFPGDSNWKVESGSILDTEYIESLGTWDIVYSWGVLHHTGDMQAALRNISKLAARNGHLFIAIYNDQGRASRFWLRVKKTYNRLPRGLRWSILWPAALRLWGPTTIRDLIAGRPFYTWRSRVKGSLRGMSPWRDLEDWVGGLPFEVATPEQIFRFFHDRGFQLEELKTCGGGHGCNEFVFRRS